MDSGRLLRLPWVTLETDAMQRQIFEQPQKYMTQNAIYVFHFVRNLTTSNVSSTDISAFAG
jgi:hypothetical protein